MISGMDGKPTYKDPLTEMGNRADVSSLEEFLNYIDGPVMERVVEGVRQCRGRER